MCNMGQVMKYFIILSCICSILFFFFQAEDGIRDYKVTGVQTCALPICQLHLGVGLAAHALDGVVERQALDGRVVDLGDQVARLEADRKSTRLNSSHLVISYAVFCLKKKNISFIDLTILTQSALGLLVHRP